MTKGTPQATPTLAESIQDMERTFRTQRVAFEQDRLPDLESRRDRLLRVKRALKEHSDALCLAINQDFGGRSTVETQIADILGCIEAVDYYHKRVSRWMKPRKRQLSYKFLPGSAELHYQPLGVVGIVVPWNYPLYLSIGPLLPALAAGNRVMLKMSEHTPETSALLQDVLRRYFDESEVAVVTGGADVAGAFTSLPWGHLLFTGSTDIGRKVMQSAAANLTPVTLELGGKSPAIIGEDARVELAAKRIAFGKGFNAGQTCVSPDYVLVPESRKAELVFSFSSAISSMYPSLVANQNYTSIINEQQKARLARLINDARECGATILELNPGDESFTDSSKLPITLVIDPPERAMIMKEEIFGPLLPIISYEHLEEAINYVNLRPNPLALYYFGEDKSAQRLIVDSTTSGGLCINDTMLTAISDDVAFGGVGPSGMGRYHGQEGFETFSNARSVIRKGRYGLSSLASPPYSKTLSRFLSKATMR